MGPLHLLAVFVTFDTFEGVGHVDSLDDEDFAVLFDLAYRL
jgi:hypothetical protein